jgi:hypothetical protein
MSSLLAAYNAIWTIVLVCKRKSSAAIGQMPRIAVCNGLGFSLKVGRGWLEPYNSTTLQGIGVIRRLAMRR